MVRRSVLPCKASDVRRAILCVFSPLFQPSSQERMEVKGLHAHTRVLLYPPCSQTDPTHWRDPYGSSYPSPSSLVLFLHTPPGHQDAPNPAQSTGLYLGSTPTSPQFLHEKCYVCAAARAARGQEWERHVMADGLSSSWGKNTGFPQKPFRSLLIKMRSCCSGDSSTLSVLQSRIALATLMHPS